MEAKELTITPPDGYEVDKGRSTFQRIVFKPVFKPNILTEFTMRSETTRCYNINDRWAFTVFMTEREGIGYQGSQIARHCSSLYLDCSNGTWYTEEGKEIHGYLYYKSDKE